MKTLTNREVKSIIENTDETLKCFDDINFISKWIMSRTDEQKKSYLYIDALLWYFKNKV